MSATFNCPPPIEIEALVLAPYYYSDAFPDGCGIGLRPAGEHPYFWLNIGDVSESKEFDSLLELMAHVKEVLGRDPIGLKIYPIPTASFLFKSRRDRKAMV